MKVKDTRQSTEVGGVITAWHRKGVPGGPRHWSVHCTLEVVEATISMVAKLGRQDHTKVQCKVRTRHSLW